jgi:hypothetical protein
MTTISESELVAQGIMYIAPGRRKPPKGWVLAHSHVRHGKSTPNHMNDSATFGWQILKRRASLCAAAAGA